MEHFTKLMGEGHWVTFHKILVIQFIISTINPKPIEFEVTLSYTIQFSFFFFFLNVAIEWLEECHFATHEKVA